MGVVISKCHPNHLEHREFKSQNFLFEVEKQHREEVASLRRKVEEEEQKVKRLKAAAIAGYGYHGWQLEKDYFEHMKENQASREEAVEKWKKLYLAIKIELDELIRRTTESHLIRSKSDKYCCQAEGPVAQGLIRELKAKDEALEALRAKLASMEKERERKEREIDILRQSLRILTNSTRTRGRRSIKKKPSHIIVEEKEFR